ncbi:hypothetical protein NE848_09705 [Gramella jeungdoensis]|uniref:CcoQ/FixQ family Cbb3-type cytochrome c oxidase assembly chaperone n=1 Tax=Gramella jeungdoensis TaxID=708091 RepID=A0ABT0Z340_9FLAO|nr:hypothetical protein [Gramella jeungdoensis]MCM8569655.1 hypothetical protein [Gramella jeungdoensis]
MFFLIFLFGVIFFVAYINKTLNKKTEIFPLNTHEPSEKIALTFEE